MVDDFFKIILTTVGSDILDGENVRYEGIASSFLIANL